MNIVCHWVYPSLGIIRLYYKYTPNFLSLYSSHFLPLHSFFFTLEYFVNLKKKLYVIFYVFISVIYTFMFCTKHYQYLMHEISSKQIVDSAERKDFTKKSLNYFWKLIFNNKNDEQP